MAVGSRPASIENSVAVHAANVTSVTQASTGLIQRRPGDAGRVSRLMTNENRMGRPRISPVGSRNPRSKEPKAAPSQ